MDIALFFPALHGVGEREIRETDDGCTDAAARD